MAKAKKLQDFFYDYLKTNQDVTEEDFKEAFEEAVEAVNTEKIKDNEIKLANNAVIDTLTKYLTLKYPDKPEIPKDALTKVFNDLKFNWNEKEVSINFHSSSPRRTSTKIDLDDILGSFW